MPADDRELIYKFEKTLSSREASHKEGIVLLQLRQENIDYFNANLEQIIFPARKALSENDYQNERQREIRKNCRVV